MSVYEVIVGNIGTVLTTDDQEVALQTAREYIGQSRQDYSRATGEDVTVMRDGEIFHSYVGEPVSE